MKPHKESLEMQRKTLITELESIAVQDRKTGDWVAKPVSASVDADTNLTADNVEDWNERRALVAQLEMRFHNVSLALEKFETGSFGFCEICNEHIEVDRLEINPAARTCKIHLERERELPY